MVSTSRNSRSQDEVAYRAYEIGDDGKIERSTPILAQSDDDALAQAQQLVNGRDVELWDRGRLIARLPSG